MRATREAKVIKGGEVVRKGLRKVQNSELLAAMRAELAHKIAALTRAEGDTPTGIHGLRLYRRSVPTSCASAAYQPCVVVFAQGEKRINVGRTTYVCNGTTFLLTSVDLPVLSQVTKASAKEPILDLDMTLVREILAQQEFHLSEAPALALGMAIGTTPPELLDACLRLLDLLGTPQDIPFLGSLLQREIIYRLLCGPLGSHLRAIATLGEQGNRTAKAVAWLRTNYAKPLRVQELASVARMGVSTLHHQFRLLTAMSPLQYQKQIRLHVARERMLHEGLDAASAAFEVGYESASQFSREYRRFFGMPPIRDVKARRLTGIERE
jgi:AraC-like DNA-binding protein